MYAIITGASSGFGIEFARQLAQRGYDLCIVARRESNLLALKKELNEGFGIHVDIFVADISIESECQRLYEFTKGKTIDILINNAGIAIGGMPNDNDIGKEIEMLNINVRAVHLLTRLFLTDMIATNNGRILNISSLSGWLPSPLLSAYAAGKSYVLALSEGINFELKEMKSKVRVSVATPGIFNTGITEIQGIQMVNQHRSIPKFVSKVIDKFLNGKEIIIVGSDHQIKLLQWFVSRKLAKLILYLVVKHSFSFKS